MDTAFSNVTTSPRQQARLAGLLYLIVDIAAGFAMIVRSKLIVHGDATATANNILAHEFLFRMAFAAELVACVINIPLAVIFFGLFRVVNKQLSLIVMLLIVAGSIVQAVVLLDQYEPLILLNGSHYLNAFGEKQLQVQAYTYLDLQNVGLAVAMVFFGCYCLITGYLIFKSSFLPGIIGVLLAIEALTYLSDSFAVFLAPKSAPLFFSILMVTGLAEMIFDFWLIIMGVNVKKWNEKAKSSGYTMFEASRL